MIGIEIIDNAYQKLNDIQISADFPDGQRCPYEANLSNDIKTEMHSLSYHVQLLRKIFHNNIQIGIGFNANCQHCMPLLTIPQCLDSQLLDFITIRSINNASMNQYYSHFKLEQEYKHWLMENLQMKIPGIFYTIHALNEDDRVYVSPEMEKTLNKYAIGYFIPASNRKLIEN